MIDTKLASYGFILEPSKYSLGLGYSGLKAVISGKPTERFFDVKKLHLPTFDGRFFHPTQVTRHELAPTETFQVSLGELGLESHRGEHLRLFSFGGVLQTKVDMGDLYCEFTSGAPIFKLQDDPGSVSAFVANEILDLMAEKEAGLAGHKDELYSRLSKIEPYPLFLACMVSMQKRADSIPMNLRREKYQKLISGLKRASQAVRDTDGWDGHSPSLEELLSNGGGA